MILAGDVGGTKVHLALYNFVGGRLGLVRENKFPSGEHASLDDVVKTFLTQDKGRRGKRSLRRVLGVRGRFATGV